MISVMTVYDCTSGDVLTKLSYIDKIWSKWSDRVIVYTEIALLLWWASCAPTN